MLEPISGIALLYGGAILAAFSAAPIPWRWKLVAMAGSVSCLLAVFLSVSHTPFQKVGVSIGGLIVVSYLMAARHWLPSNTSRASLKKLETWLVLLPFGLMVWWIQGLPLESLTLQGGSLNQPSSINTDEPWLIGMGWMIAINVVGALYWLRKGKET